MTHNEKKLVGIMEELTMFFLDLGSKDIRSRINVKNGNADMEITADYPEESKERLEILNEYFQEPKNEALEDFYWELAGCSDTGESSQMMLVGMMVDRAEIEIGEQEVKVFLSKKLADR